MKDDLKERLRKVESSRDPYRGQAGVTTNWYRNPDGPEAADRIAQLEAITTRIASEAVDGWVYLDQEMREMLAALGEGRRTG